MHRPQLLFTLGASLVVGQRFTNTTSTNELQQPLALGDFRFQGCEASTTGFPGFEKAASADDMSLDLCAARCSSAFFGVASRDCFCGNVLDSTSSNVHDAKCDSPCPGNPQQICGGTSGAPVDAPPPLLVLSLYQRLDSGDSKVVCFGDTCRHEQCDRSGNDCRGTALCDRYGGDCHADVPPPVQPSTCHGPDCEDRASYKSCNATVCPLSSPPAVVVGGATRAGASLLGALLGLAVLL